MENPVKKYELEQNGKKYTLSTQIYEDKLRLVCIEINEINPIVYTGEFSLFDLMQLNQIFTSISSISEVDAIFDKMVVGQKISIEQQENYINLKIIIVKEDKTEDKFILKLNLFSENVTNNEQISSQPINNIQLNPQQESLNPIISLNKNNENMVYSPNNIIQNQYEQTIHPQVTENITNINTNILSPNISQEHQFQTPENQSNGNILLNSISTNSPINIIQSQYLQTPETQATDDNTNTMDNTYNSTTNFIQEQYGGTPEQTKENIMLDAINNKYNYENVQKHKTKRKRIDKLTLSLRAIPKNDKNEILLKEWIRSLSPQKERQESDIIVNTPIIEQQVNIGSYTPPPPIIQPNSSENDNLKNEIKRLNEIITQLRSEIEILKQENQNLKQRNSDIIKNISNGNENTEIIYLKEENERIIKEMELLKEEFSEFEEYKRIKEDEINFLKLQNEELLQNLRRMEEYGIEKEKEIEELKIYIDELIRNQKMDEFQYKNIQKQSNEMNMEEELLTIQDMRLEIVKGDIIQDTKELELLTRKISKNNKKVSLNLLYKATIDSDKAEVFHKKCDSAKSSLVLVKIGNGKRFGGYTTCSWKGNCIEKKDNNAFVFSLDKMKIYDVIPDENAIGCYPKYGPIFLGCQIRIYDEFFKNGGTTFEKELNYQTEEDFELSGGLNKFDVKEIEVYSVELH